MSSYFKVQTQGQPLRVKIVNAAGTAPTVYTTSAISPTHTMPKTVRTDTEFWFADGLNGTPLTVTVTDTSGVVLVSETHIADPNKPWVFGPEPTPEQRFTRGANGNGLLPDGAIAETFPRYLPVTNGSVLSTGRISAVGIHLPKGAVVNSISFLSATTALSGGTNQIFGITDSSKLLLGQSADDTSTAWSANSIKTLSLATPVTTTYSGLHYLVISVAGTVPTLHSYTGSTVSTTLVPIITGTADSSITATFPATVGTITPTAVMPYAYVS